MDFVSKYEKDTFVALKKEHPGAVISQSFLRIENKVLNNKAVYTFPILAIGSEVSTEVKLDKNDLFVCTRLGHFVYQRNTASANEGAQPLQTYPNQQYFTAGTNFVDTDLECIYNGSLQFKKGTNVIGEKIPTLDFRWVATTQQSSTLLNSEYYGGKSGFKPLIPAIKMPGREQFSIESTYLTFNNIQWQHDGTNLENRLVLIPFGFLVKGANI